MRRAGSYEGLLESYARQAPLYDQRWRHYTDATLHATIEATPWEEIEQVLDVGCGTGLLEERVRELHPGTRFTGTDLSPVMLRRARTKLGASELVRWIQAKAEDLPFRGAHFDAVLCANCFHYFRQPVLALAEFRRVLRPDGWLILTDWCDDYVACKICNWYLRVADPAHFRMYGLRRCKTMVAEAGFRVEQARRFKIDWLWGLMMLRARS